jgi:hypothetical protein
MYAVNNGPITWILLWLAGAILICGAAYLGRKFRKQWDEEDEHYVQ